MEIISVNIGERVEVEWNNKKEMTGIYKYPVDGELYLDREDVKNDVVVDRKYHGGLDKACYLYSADYYDYWKNKYNDLQWNWGMFGENLTVSGVDEAKVKIGSIYKVGSAVVQVSQPRQPCYKLGIRFNNQKVIKEFMQHTSPGIYLRVLEPGVVKVGDKLIIQNDTCGSVSVQDVHSLFGANKNNKMLIKMALNEINLAESCKESLFKKLK